MALKYGSLFNELNNNIFNESSFDYLLGAVKAKIFGQEVYPSIYEKTSLYFRSIICNHIFFDGNKRTGLESALLFLEKNGYTLNQNVSNQNLIDFALETAGGKYNSNKIVEWFKANVVQQISS